MKNNDVLKNKVINGVVWKLLEKIGMQLIQFIIQIVLARLLLPSDYGIVGILTIFITISDVIIQQGFTTALIQKKIADQIDYSSVFFANIVLSIFLYALLYIGAPIISNFYNEPVLVPVTRILSLNIIIGGFSAIHYAIMQKKLEFKQSFLRGIFNVIAQGIVGIILAINGAGIWSLVFSKLAGTIVGSIILIVAVHWKPSILFL